MGRARDAASVHDIRSYISSPRRRWPQWSGAFCVAPMSRQNFNFRRAFYRDGNVSLLLRPFIIRSRGSDCSEQPGMPGLRNKWIAKRVCLSTPKIRQELRYRDSKFLLLETDSRQSEREREIGSQREARGR